MIVPGSATRIFLAPEPTDLRRSFDGLYGLVQSLPAEAPPSGHLFLFCNQPKTRLKVLCFEGRGLWVCAKRLGRGRCTWPGGGGWPQGALVLGGVGAGAGRVGTDESIPPERVATRVNKTRIFIDPSASFSLVFQRVFELLYGAKSEQLFDPQLARLALEPGVTRAEVTAEMALPAREQKLLTEAMIHAGCWAHYPN